MTGLSATSLTKITAQLKEARLLVERVAVAGGDTGRPRVPVALDTSYHRFMGVHIGLRRTTGGLVDLAGERRGRAGHHPPADQPEGDPGRGPRAVR